jgi:hypothetical protein
MMRICVANSCAGKSSPLITVAQEDSWPSGTGRFTGTFGYDGAKLADPTKPEVSSRG